MNGWNAFHIAISKNSFKQIPLYLHTNLNATSTLLSSLYSNSIPAASGHSPIMIASCEGLSQWVTELISRGVDLSHKELAHRETALHYASINGHSTIVQLLVDAGMSTSFPPLSSIFRRRGQRHYHRRCHSPTLRLCKRSRDHCKVPLATWSRCEY